MTATSGTRLSATAGGYDIEDPTAVYPKPNPDGMAPEGTNEGGQSNDSSTQFRVEDEHGNVVTMNSEQLAEYITANGVTEDFTFDDGTPLHSAHQRRAESYCCGNIPNWHLVYSLR